MLKTIQRLFAGSGLPRGWPAVAQWAHGQGHVFKRSRDGAGFVIGVQDARLEWGPSHRGYIGSHELRMRSELNAAPNLQMLVMSRPLMDALEKQAFEQAAEGSKKRADAAPPEEMRWLVLCTKLPPSEMHALRETFGAVASVPQAVSLWLEGPLSRHLKQARSSWLEPGEPLVLSVQRSRLTLRGAMKRPDAARVAHWAALFEVARQEAQRVADQWNWGTATPSTQPSLFPAQPELPARPKG
jgi:hypothetical protein